MIFERLKTPGLAHLAYLLGDKGEAAIVDPGRDIDEYLRLARQHKLTIRYVIETHRQEDFVMGSAELARRCDAKIINGRGPEFGHGDIRLADGERFDLCETIAIQALHTPGHTPESMCYAVYLSKESEPGTAWAVFTGDTLFIGEAGRTDLSDPAKTGDAAGMLYDAVHARLLPLGDQALVLPAHGSGSVCGGNIAQRDDSTLGLERRYNPVFTLSRDEFVASKLRERIPRPPYFRHMEEVNAKGGMGALRGAAAVKVLQPESFQRESRRGLVFDLRSPEAFAGGHVPGSISIWADGLSVFAGWVAEAGDALFLVTEDGQSGLEDAVTALGRVGLDNVAGVLAGGFGAWRSSGLPMAGVGTMDHRQVADAASGSPGGALRVLDVREDSEFEDEGHIAGASHLFVGYLDSDCRRMRPAPDKTQRVVTVCSVGHRASLAASLLLRAGFEDVHNMLGGMDAWEAAGRATTQGASEHSVTTPEIEGERR